MNFSSNVLSIVNSGLLVYCLALAPSAWAVDCTPADITLASQAEVDNFQANHGPCDSVANELRIEGEDIVNLAALSGLITIRDLNLRHNAQLAQLDGLSALTELSGLWLTGNDVLLNLQGMTALERVGTLYIVNNPSLTSLEGLSPLTQLSDTTLRGNPSLVSLNGLQNIRHVRGNWFEIIDNDALLTLNSLASLETVTGSLIIGGNDALENIDGLSSLSLVGIESIYNLEISQNTALTNLDGLSSLTELEGGLLITLNDSLSSLGGLSSLTRVGAIMLVAANPVVTNLNGFSAMESAGGLMVINNQTLADCQGIVKLIDPVDDFEPGPGPGISGIPDISGPIPVAIENNAAGCNSTLGILGKVPLAEMNAGLNDAWFNLETNGQGFLIIVFPEIEQIFMAWFTYDTQRPPDNVLAILGEPGHRWLTAQGSYQGAAALLEISNTFGGIFDSPLPETSTVPAGEILLEFSNCNSGTVSYDMPSIGLQSIVSIERITLDNVSLCYLLANSETPP